jgi:hypothetical protein
MNPLVARLKKIPPLARALAAGAGFTALLSLALPAPGRGPAMVTPPPARALTPVPQPESRPVAGPVTLTSLVIGCEPPVMMPGRRFVATFVTDDSESCRIVATAKLAAGIDPSEIHWTVASPAGFVVPVAGNWTGARLDVVLRRPGGNPTGLGGPLAVTVQARVQPQGQEEFTARETVVQDKIDQLRQEYIDLQRRELPERSDFLDAASFTARYGRSYPWLHFEDLNWSVDPATGDRYSYALVRPELVEGLDRLRRMYGGVIINSGYRNPVRQLAVHAPVRESLHQYGYAADLAVAPGEGRALPNEVDWRRLAEVACRAQAKWIEPLDSCAPNSPGCHVHMDYRPGPASSAPVRLRGQVVDAATGKPVSGALVLLGAMPAQTDAKGFFVIRNVLSGGPHPVEVRAKGYAGLVQPVPLVAWGSASAQLAVHAEDGPSVTVELARTDWIDRRAGLLSLTLRVTSSGWATANDVRLSPVPEAATIIRQDPIRFDTLPAGAVRAVKLVVRLRERAAPVSIPLRVAFRDGFGAEEVARYSLTAVLPDASLTVSADGRPGAPAARGSSPMLPTSVGRTTIDRPSSPSSAASRPASRAPKVTVEPRLPDGKGAETGDARGPTQPSVLPGLSEPVPASLVPLPPAEDTKPPPAKPPEAEGKASQPSASGEAKPPVSEVKPAGSG